MKGNQIMKNRNTITIFTAILFGLSCFALPQRTQAVSPAPDGGYPGGNTANGALALFSNTIGFFNTATGHSALQNNTTGAGNTAVGSGALIANTTGSVNTAIGVTSLSNNVSGDNNTAVGASALQNSTGSNNVALGHNAGS